MDSFIRKLLVFSISLLGAGLLIMFLTGSLNLSVPFFTGWLISFANSIIGYRIIRKAFDESGKGFFNTILLSMVLRMFAMLGIFAVLILLAKLDRINLAVSLFLFYFLFLILEINYLQNRQKELGKVSQ